MDYKSITYFGGYISDDIAYRKPLGGYNAASNKMNYITDLLKRVGFHVTIIAYYHTLLTGINPYIKKHIDDKETRIYLPGIDVKRGLLRKISGLSTYISVFWAISKLPRKSNLLIYNMPQFSRIISLLQKYKGFNIILDIEEIMYFLADTVKKEKVKKREETLYRIASKYIVVNDLIQPRFLSKEKPHVVIYGNYKIVPKLVEKINDGRVHVTFSGSIDTIRGADRAVECACYLSNNYCVHLTGYGRESVVTQLRKRIDSINNEAGIEKVIYHGQLCEEYLDSFIEGMHIGLNLQDLYNPFESVSFPSKIIFYLSHGLNVVSSKLSCVMASTLSDYLTYFEGNNPESIAIAIRSVRIATYEKNVSYLRELDELAYINMEKLMHEKN